MPNHIARSSLFAPVARGKKKTYKNSLLVSRKEAEIMFSGTQLDESQADVWMQAMYEASKQPLGQPVAINRARFLRAIGRKTGNYEYKWLHEAMEDLCFAMLIINVYAPNGQTKLSIGMSRTQGMGAIAAGARAVRLRKTDALHMIKSFSYDCRSETYTIEIDPRWSGLYGNHEFALIDWEKRLRFGRGKDMSKALQRLIATSRDRRQGHPLEWLKMKLGYHSPDKKFCRAIEAAMLELERLEIIANGRISRRKGGDLYALWIRL